MPFVGRDTSGQIVIESLEVIPGISEESIADTDPELLASRGTKLVDDRPTPRRTLEQRPDATPVTIKDLKDLRLL